MTGPAPTLDPAPNEPDSQEPDAQEPAAEHAGAGVAAVLPPLGGPPRRDAALLALGFGTTVAMWALAYLCRLPAIQAPGWLLGTGFLLLLIGGGAVAGRSSGRALEGAKSSTLSSALNLLILGSVFKDVLRGNAAQAVFWVPGTLLLGALLGGVGGALGARGAAGAKEVNWSARFALVAATATLLLLAAGGLVTSHDAGLAVPDWPNSFETNMFLYPLSRMTGGIYYEHAHRLFGSLVGLTTLVLAGHIVRNEERGWLRRLAVVAFVLVVVQGVMGGLRVTGRLTTSTNAADLAPSIELAVAHGVTGQLFFCLLGAIAAFLSTPWRAAAPGGDAAQAEDTRILANGLVALLLVQLLLGALLRHLHTSSAWHITGAVFVLLVAGGVGLRCWGFHGDRPVLPTLGKVLCGLVGFQFLLGWVALAATLVKAGALADLQPPITTLHQTTGALVLATAIQVRLWAGRVLPPDAPPAPAAPASG
ncbi:MAG: COX15/CtaA family protein [Planctomycetota bacterium]